MALNPDGQAVVESKSVAQQATNQGAAPVGETSDVELKIKAFRAKVVLCSEGMIRVGPVTLTSV